MVVEDLRTWPLCGTAHSLDAPADVSAKRGAFHDRSRFADTRRYRRGIQAGPATSPGTAGADFEVLRADSSSRGASLKEVADFLGHQCLDTTTIYAKLDLPALREVALPWPEVLP